MNGRKNSGKHRNKRSLAVLLILLMIAAMAPMMSAGPGASGNAGAVYAASSGKLTLTMGSNRMDVNGTKKDIDAQGTKPEIKMIGAGGYTMLPIRAVVESMGGTAGWTPNADGTCKEVIMNYNNQKVTLTIGSKTAVVDGVSKTMSIAPYVTEEGRTMVWIRTVEFFQGISVDWTTQADGTTKDVIVGYGGAAASTAASLVGYITNNTGYALTSVTYAPASTGAKSDNVLVINLAAAGTASFALNRTGTDTTYHFYAVDTSGRSYIYSNVSVAGASRMFSLVLNADNTVVTGIDSMAAVPTVTTITFVNNSGVKIAELYISEKNNTTAWGNSKNVLSSSLSSGSTTTFEMKLGSTKKWYFSAIDANDKTYVGYVTFSGTGVVSALLTLSDDADDSFALTRQSLTAEAAATELTFRNYSGVSIAALYMADSNTESRWSSRSNLLAATLTSGSTTQFDIDLGDATRWYFRAKDSAGNTYTGYVTFNSVNVTKGILTLTDDDDYSFSLTGQDGTGSAVTENKIQLTFANNSGSRISELYMSKKNTASGWEEAKNLLSASVSLSDSTTLKLDLEDSVKWYFRAASGSTTATGYVTFDSLTMESATLTLQTLADDAFLLTKQVEAENDNGLTTLTFKNLTDEKITALYMADRRSNLSSADNLLSSGVSAGKSKKVDVDLYGGTEWYFRATDSAGDFYQGPVYFSSTKLDSAVLTLPVAKDSSFLLSEQYIESSDTTFGVDVLFRNKSGYQVTEVCLARTDNSAGWTNPYVVYDSVLADGKSADMKVDLNGETEWYVRVYYSSLDYKSTLSAKTQVTFDSLSVDSATLTFSGTSGDDIVLSNQK